MDVQLRRMSLFIHHTFKAGMSYCNTERIRLPSQVTRLKSASISRIRSFCSANAFFFSVLPYKQNSCANFSTRMFSRGEKFSFCARYDFYCLFGCVWRRRSEMERGWSAAAKRFKPCLDCHILWACMSESTKSSGCSEWHHAPANPPPNSSQTVRKSFLNDQKLHQN